MGAKLIALDLDGTTLNSKNQLTKTTKAALIKAAEKGVEIVPVTGRCYKSLPQELLELSGGQCIRYAVTSNGAEIRAARTGEILYQNYIDPRGSEEIKRVLHKKEIMLEVYVKGSAYIEQSYYDRIEKGQITYRSRDYVLTTRVPVRGVINLLAVHKDSIEKVAVYFDRFSAQDRMKEEFKAVTHAHVTSSGTNNVELIAKGCSKAKTLDVLCDSLGLSMTEVMAVGDSQNDIEMLKAAGIAVAMGNAGEAVKKCADHVTASNDRNGVAKVIEREIG